MSEALNGISIHTRLRPGDLGAIVQMHGEIYAAEYGLDCTFEPYVAVPLSEFVLRNDDRERIWTVTHRQRIVGSVAIVAASATEAQLRWLLVAPAFRGQGLGRQLVAEALDFCRRCCYASVFLWTLGHLESALTLYRSFGFQRVHRNPHRLWGQDLVEEQYVLQLGAAGK